MSRPNVGDRDYFGDVGVSARVHLGPTSRIEVSLPRIVRAGSGRGPLHVPFNVGLGYSTAGTVSIVAPRAELVRLRNTLTAALDADASSEPEDDTSGAAS